MRITALRGFCGHVPFTFGTWAAYQGSGNVREDHTGTRLHKLQNCNKCFPTYTTLGLRFFQKALTHCRVNSDFRRRIWEACCSSFWRASFHFWLATRSLISKKVAWVRELGDWGKILPITVRVGPPSFSSYVRVFLSASSRKICDPFDLEITVLPGEMA